MNIVDAIIGLKQAFAEQEGEVLQITLDKKGGEVLDKICNSFYIPTCPTCGKPVTDDMFLGIKIIKEKSIDEG